VAIFEKILPPLYSIPRDAAPPIPPKNAIGTEMTKAHGQDITRKISARYMESAKVVNYSKAGIIASKTAAETTIGV
jgi:hypothetical protein